MPALDGYAADLEAYLSQGEVWEHCPACDGCGGFGHPRFTYSLRPPHRQVTTWTEGECPACDGAGRMTPKDAREYEARKIAGNR